MVKIAGGKMTMLDYEVCKLGNVSLQVKNYAEAPSDGSISRDNFVASATAYQFVMIQQLGQATCKSIAAPIGSTDLDILVYMSKEGMKIEFEDQRTKASSSQTILWPDLFK